MEIHFQSPSGAPYSSSALFAALDIEIAVGPGDTATRDKRQPGGSSNGETGSPPVYSSDALFAALGIDIGASAGRIPPGGEGQGRSGPDPWQRCRDGERTQRLASLLGKWYREGDSVEDATFKALGWNSRNQPPLPEDKVRSTAESMWRTHHRNHGGAKAANAPITPLFDLALTRVDQLLDNNPLPRDWLLDGCLPWSKVGALVAGGGTGKSQFLLQLAVSVATGHPPCEYWKIGQQGSALAIFAEDDMDDIHRRLANIQQELAGTVPNFDALVRQNLYIHSAVGDFNLMTRELQRGGVEATDYVDRLLLAIKGIPDLKLIALDPGSRFRGGNENAAEDATRFVEQLERIKSETGATVLVAHHMHKGAAQQDAPSQHAARGSSALTDGVRWQMNLGPISDKLMKANGISEHDRHRHLLAQVTKTNYSPPQDGVVLMRKDGGYLTALKRTTLEDRISDLINQEARANKKYTANQFEDKFAGEAGPLKAGKVTVRKAIADMVKARRLDGGKGKHLRVKPDLSREYGPAAK
jgi:RecA-family ATPase